jgi:lantibiotic modifying enzyme
LVAARLAERSVSRLHGPLRSGFSHGAAGIALALLRLHAASGIGEFHDAASELVTYERSLFVPASSNWRTLPNDDDAATCQWCYGAAGVGLARIGCLSLTDDAETSQEISAALDATKAATPLLHDHLCCGNFGRIDFLLTAGLRLDQPALLALARQSAMQRIQRAVAQGGFRWRIADDSLNPSLFQGIAGIGYELLRLAEPGVLPSILCWD